MTIQTKKLTQEYFHSIDMSDLPQEVDSIIYNHAISTERMINYVDGDFSHPTSFSRLEELLKPFSDEFDEDCETDEERSENPYRQFLNDLPVEITSDPTQQFLIEFYQ